VKSPKKPSRRSNTKYPNLKPEFNLKIRQEEIQDIASYANSLPPEAKAWLDRFVEEEINASFVNGGTFNKTKEEQRKIYTRNNTRNRDIYSLSKASGKLVYNSVTVDNYVPPDEYENADLTEEQSKDKKKSKNKNKKKGSH
jgi:hypothetical protein